MALQGTLETFSVPEVLRLLAGTRKTGMLALEGDRGTGQVWLDGGRIVGARSAQAQQGGDVDGVLFDLLRYAEGSFVFETDAPYLGDSPVDADVEEALGAAEELLAEWHEIASVVPSLRVWVSMVPAIGSPSVTVTAEQWAALAIVGRGTSGHRLVDELGLGELDGSRRIRDLVADGLVEVDDTPVSTPDEVDELRDGLGDAGEWTTTDDLTVGLAGFVARIADEERIEREPIDLGTFEAPLAPEEPDLDEVETFEHVEVIEQADEPDHVGVFGFDVETADVDEAGDELDAVPDLATVLYDADEDEALEDDEAVAEVHPADAAAEEDHEADAARASDDVDEADDDEFLSQLANLSPKAAAAIEATASAGETSRKLPNGEADEEINRNLLLKFLSSAKP